jgi:hypothetical protein
MRVPYSTGKKNSLSAVHAQKPYQIYLKMGEGEFVIEQDVRVE